jgi:hypothetical protein
MVFFGMDVPSWISEDDGQSGQARHCRGAGGRGQFQGRNQMLLSIVRALL